MKNFLFLFFLFFLSYSPLQANFICEDISCNDSQQQNPTGALYEKKDYFLSKMENEKIINISSLFDEHIFPSLFKNELNLSTEIKDFLTTNPSNFVILRKDGESPDVNYAIKIRCSENGFLLESNNEKILYKKEIFNLKNCQNIEKKILREKIIIFGCVLFIVLGIIGAGFYLRKKRK